MIGKITMEVNLVTAGILIVLWIIGNIAGLIYIWMQLTRGTVVTGGG